MSDSFIHELMLRVYPHDEKELDLSLEMSCFIYNAVINEGLKRIQLIKQSKVYQEAKKSKDKQSYNKARKLYKFSDYDLQKFAIKSKNNCFIKDHLKTHIAQKVATRAYLALDKYLKGKGGKPRFKNKNSFSSFEGKSNITGIIFKDNKIRYNNLVLRPIFNKKDELEAHALTCRVKYVRLVRKIIKGKKFWFAQLILEGKPFVKQKNKSKDEIVGLDIGPSTIAVYQDSYSFLDSFCSELEPYHLQQKKLQRKMDRSLRSMNPDNYNEDKTIKKEAKTWKKSKSYKKSQKILSEVYRKLKVARKRLHGKLANKIIRLGNIIKTEKLSYKSFQKTFGRSIGFRAPSMFLQILKHKAANAGGLVEEFDTKTTCLSQICHNCLKKEKKSLKIRWHNCLCGIEAQRDLYSAFLARHVKENKLDIVESQKDWPGANILLEQAISRLKETANEKQMLFSFGLDQRKSCSPVKDGSIANNLKDVVGNNFREPIEVCKHCH